jgi:hypothetical protein
MSCYMKRQSRGKTYICQSTSFRNEKGRPDNKKIIIEKIDTISNEIILNDLF